MFWKFTRDVTEYEYMNTLIWTDDALWTDVNCIWIRVGIYFFSTKLTCHLIDTISFHWPCAPSSQIHDSVKSERYDITDTLLKSSELFFCVISIIIDAHYREMSIKWLRNYTKGSAHNQILPYSQQIAKKQFRWLLSVHP